MTSTSAFVIWITKDPERNKPFNVKYIRKLFLEEIGSILTHHNIVKRDQKIREDGRGFATNVCGAIESRGLPLEKKTVQRDVNAKKIPCFKCRNDNKYSTKYDKCKRFICPNHSETSVKEFLICDWL